MFRGSFDYLYYIFFAVIYQEEAVDESTNIDILLIFVTLEIVHNFRELDAF